MRHVDAFQTNRRRSSSQRTTDREWSEIDRHDVCGECSEIERFGCVFFVRRETTFFRPLDKTSTDAYRSEYESSREKFQDYIQHLERLLKERRALKQNFEQAEIFYDAQYQDANIVVEVRWIDFVPLSNDIRRFQAYKNFGDKVATLKRKLDSLIRDLPETVSPPSADNVPSPGKTTWSERFASQSIGRLL